MRFTKLLFLSVLLVSCSQEKPKEQLTIYTSRQPQLIEPLLEQYKEKTGVEVRLLSGKAPQLMERIAVEGTATEADIFMTVDAGVLWQAGKKEIFEEIDSNILNKNIPEHLRDADGKWFGLSKRARTIVYNSDLVSAKDLTSYEDLAYPKWANRLCLRTSTKVYNRSLIASMIDVDGFAATKNVVQGWVNNLATEVFSSDTQVLKAVSAGQCAVTIVNTYYLARLADDPKYATHISRGDNTAELDAMIGEWSRTWEMKDLINHLIEEEVPHGLVYTAKDMIADPHIQARESIINVDVPGVGEFPMQNIFPFFSDTKPSIRWSGPAHGEHTDEVYGDIKKNYRSNEKHKYEPSSPYSATKAGAKIALSPVNFTCSPFQNISF